MPTSFTFEYTLPFHDHAWQSRTTKFIIEASVDDFGFITFVPPSCQQITNHERVHRDITLAARKEFEKIQAEKWNRIYEGGKVLEQIMDENELIADAAGWMQNNILKILITLIIALILSI